jgi:type II secretory pathway component PulC
MKLARHPLVIVLLALVVIAIVAGVVLGPRWKRARAGRGVAVTNAVVAVTKTTGTNVFAPKTTGTNVLAQAKAKVVPDREIDRQQAQSRLKSWVEAPVRDPFQVHEVVRETKPTDLAQPTVQSLTLNGIWRQSDSVLVVINRHIYGLGDELQGFKIERIEADRVLIQGPERKEVLQFARRPSATTRTNAPNAGQRRP